MQTIFIQVKAELGRAYKVAEEAIESVEQVSEAYSTSGQFDLLFKCYLLLLAYSFNLKNHINY